MDLFRRWRKQESSVVFRMPPSCLKALLLKRNGVLPGTTSMESHNLFLPDWFIRGTCTRKELVRDWLLPKRNFTWLSWIRIWLCRISGKLASTCFQTLSPITHRLAPVSKMAKLGRSVLDTKQVATSVAARQGSVVAVASAGAEGRSNLCRAVEMIGFL